MRQMTSSNDGETPVQPALDYFLQALLDKSGSPQSITQISTMSNANALAKRLEDGARALASFAESLTDAQWKTRVPKDGRKIGGTVHHVASVYPIEIQLAQTIASGKPVTGVTGDGIDQMNAGHAKENDAVTKAAALDLLRRNKPQLAAAIRAKRRGARSRDASPLCTRMLLSRASFCSRITRWRQLSHLARLRAA